MDRENILDKDASVESQNSLERVTARILKTDGNTVKLSLATLAFGVVAIAFLVALAFVPSVFYLDSTDEISLAVALICTVSDLAILAGIVFIAVPLATGIMYYAMFTVLGFKPYFIELFMPFERGLYWRSIATQIIVFTRILIIALPLAGGITYLPLFFADFAETSPLLVIVDSAFVLCETIAATFIGAYLSSFLFFAPYLIIAHNKKASVAILESFRLGRGRRLEIVKMTMRSVLDMFLSAISFMVLFVVYAMPRMTVSYFVYCNKVAGIDETIMEQYK